MSKIIHDRTNKYIDHKTNILIERVYLAIQDKIFDAENYDEFEIDSDNNIYVTYSLKRDENIISETHDLIADQIKRKYRRKLEARLEEESYFVEYDDSDIHIYFEKPLKADNDDSSEISSIKHSSEQNILKYKKVNKQTLLTGSEDSGEFDFGDEDN
jgi:hypothetical protein